MTTYLLPDVSAIGSLLAHQLVEDKSTAKSIAQAFTNYYDSLYVVGGIRVTLINIVDLSGTTDVMRVRQSYTIANSSIWTPRFEVHTTPTLRVLMTSDDLPSGYYYDPTHTVSSNIFNYGAVLWLLFGASTGTISSPPFKMIIDNVPCTFPQQASRCGNTMMDYQTALNDVASILDGTYYRYPSPNDILVPSYTNFIDALRTAQGTPTVQLQVLTALTPGATLFNSITALVLEEIKWQFCASGMCGFRRLPSSLIDSLWSGINELVVTKT